MEARGRGSASATTLLLLVALLSALQPAASYNKTVEVSTCAEYKAALLDPTVDHVLLEHVPGGWNCTESEWPPFAVRLQHRNVTLEGKGPGRVYFLGNRLPYQVAIGQGAYVTHKNMWADNCLHGSHPYACFSNPDPYDGGGHTTTENGELSDATCVNVRRSQGIAGLAVVLPFAKVLRFKADYEWVDSRRLLIRYTDWMPATKGNYFRFINTTLSCTGNITFPLPPDFKDDVEVRVLPVSPWKLAAGGLALALMGAGLYWFKRRSACDSTLPEYKIAASQGFQLEEPLGSGHFGRVYKARDKSTGQVMAVKVVDVLPTQRRQVAAAWRECQLMAQVKHECIVRVVTFYTAQVQQRQHVVEATSKGGGQYLGVVYDVQPTRGLDDSANVGSLGSGGTIGSGGSVSSGGTAAGVRSIQMHLVMQYCDMGTLDQAIKAGTFWDEDTGEPLLRHIALTALEVARGLAYLHHPDRKMVHRDLSAANVLLASSGADERGFRALLSDFGLSTSLAEEATHKTSEVKGTISYMSPEVFLHDDISPALDIYSFGIILYMLCAGLDPFANQTPAMAILAKVRAAEHPDDSRLPVVADIPPPLQQLIWDCTHHNRRSRPTSAQLVERLEALLMTL